MTNVVVQSDQPDDLVSIPVYDGTDLRMLHWSKYWSLSAGRIGCTRCAATQAASKNFDPFVHEDTCQFWGWRDHYPWVQLRGILAGMPTEEFQWPTGPWKVL